MTTNNWSDAVQQCRQRGDAFALITVLGCSGSTPRDQSSKMVVTGDATMDTIGGGHLEFAVTNKARELLAGNAEASQQIHHFPLGASLGQCCGGSATVLIETFPACRFQIGVFGAGHVAQALIPILAGLPCQITWVDSRREMFPDRVPTNVHCVWSDDPSAELAQLPAGADVLILTHNHPLDFELCMTALKRDDLRHIGVIGSQTKANRFRQRLAHRGIGEASIARMVCPVGLSEVPGKLPMEVAVSIAGQLIALENADRPKPQKRGLGWNKIKHELGTAAEGHQLDLTRAEPQQTTEITVKSESHDD